MILEKIKNKYGVFVGFALLIFCIVIFWSFNFLNSPKDKIILNNKTYSMEIARTSQEKTKGLSDRDSLCESCGMIFVYQNPGYYSFWMKDMNFPIDIIWLNQNKEVVFIKENLSPETYPNSYGPNLKSQYVLEFNAGFAKEHNLKFGDKIEF